MSRRTPAARTLVDSSAPVRRTWAAFAGRHGLDPDYVHRFGQGRPSREIVRLLAPHVDVAAEAAALERAEIGDADGIVALPGAGELLTGGRRLAIVTSCSRALAMVRLRAAGLPIPPVLVSADDVVQGKPDPAIRIATCTRPTRSSTTCVQSFVDDRCPGRSPKRVIGSRWRQFWGPLRNFNRGPTLYPARSEYAGSG